MRVNPPLLSICIPAYNRPHELMRLLSSIDCANEKIEIIICEDNSTQKEQISEVANKFKTSSGYNLYYFENYRNLGFDGNIRNLVDKANGRFILFMGDDDLFVANALDKFLDFLEKHADIAYVLRSYIAIHESGITETFKYLPETRVLPAGEETVAWLFKRSVSLSGFTISRELAQNVKTEDLDGTLLYQIYMMAVICLNHDSIYCDIPVTQAWQSFRENKPMFGNSEAEKSRFKPGSVSEDNSLNFTRAYFEVAAYVDKNHGTTLEEKIRVQISKYSYPFLSIQRKNGIRKFYRYAKKLEQELGLGVSIYFHIYKWSLLLLGEKVCDRLIIQLKKIIGYTPDL